jgi:aryl-alcohol dehydrogenase-like predicted oxidoreductase
MEFISLGSTNLRISRLGFGCAAMGGYDYGLVDDDESVAAVRSALELGVNFFDTANVYGFGHAEEVLSRALGGNRADVIIGTKVGVAWDEGGQTRRDLSPSAVLEALEGSLRRLRLDCIPLFQIHWPDTDTNTPIEQTMDVLRKCQEEGKIAHIGCCNFSLELIERAQRHSRIESVQLPFSLTDTSHRGVIDRARDDYSMSLLGYNCLAHGLLSGKYDAESVFIGTDLRKGVGYFVGEKGEANSAALERVTTIARFYGRTPAQVAIRWVLQHRPGSCAIVGTKTRTQAEDNSGAMDWFLSDEDCDFLSQFSS